MFIFTATHGVEFGDTVGTDYEVWAKFTRDVDLDTAATSDADEDRLGYSFSTDDPEVAERLRDVEVYGITDITPAPAPVKVAASAKPAAPPTS